MIEFYFLKKKDDFLSFDVSIEYYIDKEDDVLGRIRLDESVRLFYLKDADRFTGRYLHERSEVLFTFFSTIPEMIDNRLENGYIQIRANDYARYKRGITSRYQNQTIKEHEKAKKQ